jgi:SAM-dependent methyltransferase
MNERGEPAQRGRFAAAWDDYVRHAGPGGARWPGDEWGDEALWRRWFADLFVPYGVAGWERAIEIGQGSGKYTAMVLAAGHATVAALDVSPQFQAVCAQRLATEVAAGRLHLRTIDERDPDALAHAAAALGWTGRTDAVFSIDVLVHLTTTQIAALLLAATRALRPGGVFVGTFADATSDAGRHKLLQDVDRVVGAAGDPTTGCFHWTSPEIVRALASRCGYTVELCRTDPFHGRDGQFVLRFSDPAAAAAADRLRRR